MGYMDIWKEHAILREGKRLVVYLDSVGKATVGIGHLVLKEDGLKVGDRINEDRCAAFFAHDSKIAERTALFQAKEIGIETDWFIAALISVNFQLGDFKKKFSRMKNGELTGTYALICNGEFDAAAISLRKSLWYRQTPVRVEDFIQALEKANAFKERPLKKTRTVAGASVAGVGVVAGESVAEISKQIEPLVPYSDILQWLFVSLALAGIALTIYARTNDRDRGIR